MACAPRRLARARWRELAIVARRRRCGRRAAARASTTRRPGTCSSARTASSGFTFAIAASLGRALQRAEGAVLLVAAAARRGRRLRRCCARIGSGAFVRAGARAVRRATPTSSRAGGTGSSAPATAIAGSSTCSRCSRSASRPSSSGAPPRVARRSRGRRGRRCWPSALSVVPDAAVLERRAADQRHDVGAVPRDLSAAPIDASDASRSDAGARHPAGRAWSPRSRTCAIRHGSPAWSPAFATGRRRRRHPLSLDRRTCVVLRSGRRRRRSSSRYARPSMRRRTGRSLVSIAIDDRPADEFVLRDDSWRRARAAPAAAGRRRAAPHRHPRRSPAAGQARRADRGSDEWFR